MSVPKRVKIPQAKGKPLLVVADFDGNPVINDHFFLAWHKSSKRFFIGRTNPRIYLGRDLSGAISEFRRFVNKQEREIVILPTGKVRKLDLYKGIKEAKIVGDPVDSDVFWHQVRHLLLTDPDLVAEKTGITRIRRLDTLPESITCSLNETKNLYINKKPSISDGEKVHTEKFWKQFSRIIGVSKIEKIKRNHILAYKKEILSIQEDGMSPSYVNKRFSKVKTIFSYADKMLISPQETRRILALLSILENLYDDSSDPTPISKKDLRRLLDAANAKETFCLFLGLNCAFYPVDIRLLKKKELDPDSGVFSGRRQKKVKGKRHVQCSVLWKRTIKAIRKQLRDNPNSSEYYLVSQYRKPYSAEGSRKMFAALRRRAGVSETVKFDHLRDGAASHCGTNAIQMKVLIGHKFAGEDDRYVLRNPREHTEYACNCVEKYYFGK